MRLHALAVIAGVAGCHVELSGGTALTAAAPDAHTVQVVTDAVAACTRRSVYLNFEGQTLSHAATSDATQNQASWMQIDQGTAPRYRSGNANRATIIQTIVDGVTAGLAKVPITVVTTRPAAGPYVMIVFGGAASDVGSAFGGAVNQLDCGDKVPGDVAWISDNVRPNQAVINTAIGAIGFGVGLTATSVPKDCMCSWANGCMPDSSATCTLGSPIDRDPTANQLCPNTTAQDEVAVLRDAFCH